MKQIEEISALNIDFKDDDTIWLTSSKTLRKMIGILGMALPFALVLFLYIDTGHAKPLESISHYYYTRVTAIFTGIMTVLGIFLIIYKDKAIDFFVSLTAGIFALCVVSFPTSNLMVNEKLPIYAVMKLDKSCFREGFHYVSAGIFLCCLAYMSFFLFTRPHTADIKNDAKKIMRNKIYRICAVLIVVAMIVIGAGALKIIPEKLYDDNHITFWMETLAVESFGFSWLVKGSTLFRKKEVIEL